MTKRERPLSIAPTRAEEEALCVFGGEIVFLPMRRSLTTASERDREREKAIDSEGEKGSSGERRGNGLRSTDFH